MDTGDYATQNRQAAGSSASRTRMLSPRAHVGQQRPGVRNCNRRKPQRAVRPGGATGRHAGDSQATQHCDMPHRARRTRNLACHRQPHASRMARAATHGSPTQFSSDARRGHLISDQSKLDGRERHLLRHRSPTPPQGLRHRESFRIMGHSSRISDSSRSEHPPVNTRYETEPDILAGRPATSANTSFGTLLGLPRHLLLRSRSGPHPRYGARRGIARSIMLSAPLAHCTLHRHSLQQIRRTRRARVRRGHGGSWRFARRRFGGQHNHQFHPNSA